MPSALVPPGFRRVSLAADKEKRTQDQAPRGINGGEEVGRRQERIFIGERVLRCSFWSSGAGSGAGSSSCSFSGDCASPVTLFLFRSSSNTASRAAVSV
jgi:hypothetical protein